MNEDTSTLALEGFTPYAQVPRWVLRSGDDLSNGARALYGDIMTYASNTARTAFPTRETLAQDLGVSVRSIGTYAKELEDFGALKVERRRNRRTGNFYANQYTLVFTDPSGESPEEAHCPRREEAHCPITKPTTSTRPTSPTPSTSGRGESSLRSPSLSERRRERSNTQKHLLSLVRAIAAAKTDDDHETASQAFLDAFEDAGHEDIGYWDYGWSTRLDSLVRKHGIDYGSAAWLSTFANTSHAA